MALALDLATGQRAQRKTLITVAEWEDENGTITVGQKSYSRQIMGVRTEDSSIEYNADIATSTDILGINYTDVNKTQPQQTFDPHNIMGDTGLSEYMLMAQLKNDIDKYNNVFNIYVITACINETTGDGSTATTTYFAVKHSECSIIPTSLGGSDYLNQPLEVHFSNNITEGTVDKLTVDFTFTSAA